MKHVLLTIIAMLSLAGSAKAGQLARTPEETQDYLFGRYALIMRQQGLTAETAGNAVWALRHNNSGPCAYWAKQLVTNRDGIHGRFKEDLGDLVISIEQSRVCSREHLRDRMQQPEKPAYDPAKDPRRLTKAYFRNHHDGGVAMLMKVGVTPQAAERAAKLVAEDGTYSDCNARVGMILDAVKRDDTETIDSYQVVDSINKGLACGHMEYSQPSD